MPYLDVPAAQDQTRNDMLDARARIVALIEHGGVAAAILTLATELAQLEARYGALCVLAATATYAQQHEDDDTQLRIGLDSDIFCEACGYFHRPTDNRQNGTHAE